MNQDHKFRRAPIANPEAEQSVLGAILIQPQYLAEIAAIVSPDSFYWENHSLIFRAMLDLQERGDPVDLATVTLLLRERGLLAKIGGPVFLSNLSEQVGFAVNGPHYARRVQEKYLVRQLATRTREIFESCVRFNGDSNIADLFLYAESQVQDSINDLGFSEPAVITGQQLLSKDFSQLPPVLGGGLLPEGCNLMIAGESGEGKSMLRLEMAIHLSLGRDLWGLEIPRARRVLIIQFENTEQLEQVRLKRMLRGLGSDCPGNLLFSSPLARFNLSEKTDRARLIAAIEKHRAEVVIYDPLSSLHQENENDNTKMRWVMDNLTEINRRTRTTAIVVHHYGKPGKEEVSGVYRTRGASSIRDWADTLIGFSRHKSNDLVLRDLEFLKVRNGPEPKPLILDRDKDTFLHRVSDGDTVCSPGRVRAIVEDLGGQAEREELLKAIQRAGGWQQRQAENYLQNAVTFGHIIGKPHPEDGRKKIYEIV
jgi:archaellum biogenesis ATPase FlaH